MTRSANLGLINHDVLIGIVLFTGKIEVIVKKEKGKMCWTNFEVYNHDTIFQFVAMSK